jgi:ATP-dependent Lhr-like helicase
MGVMIRNGRLSLWPTSSTRTCSATISKPGSTKAPIEAHLPQLRRDCRPDRARHPGKEKSGRQVTVSADLIYDVLRSHEPDHILLQATRQDAARVFWISDGLAIC